MVAAEELGAYLQQEYGWPAVQQVGWIRRARRRLGEATWQSVETWTWMTSAPPATAGPETLAQGLRGHWTIENRVHWVRDVTWQEDRSAARQIGPVLAAVRNTGMTLLRRLGHQFIPDGWRAIPARADHGLCFLTQP